MPCALNKNESQRICSGPCSLSHTSTHVQAFWVSQFQPVEWAYLIENSFDPIHAMFLHEGTMPVYKPAEAIPIQGYKIMKVCMV